MYDWELNDDMINSCLFMMCLMIIILEVQWEVWLGKYWRSIQHLKNCICLWGFDNVWLRIWWWYDWFMIIYDEYNDNNIGDSGGSVIGEGLKVNSTLTQLYLWSEELIMCDWEFHDDTNLYLFFIKRKMLIILEVQEEVELGKDWRSIQHSQNYICGYEELITYDWEFHDDMIDLWLLMMNIMIIILEIQEEVWLERDWSSIQHLQNWVCGMRSW